MVGSYRRDRCALMCVQTTVPVYFLADTHHHKDEDIRKYGKVCLAFSDTSAQNYVSISGDAEVLTDRNLIRELWDVPAKAW